MMETIKEGKEGKKEKKKEKEAKPKQTRKKVTPPLPKMNKNGQPRKPRTKKNPIALFNQDQLPNAPQVEMFMNEPEPRLDQPLEPRLDKPLEPQIQKELVAPEMEQIKTEMDSNQCSDPNNTYSSKCNKLLLEKEKIETTILEKEPEDNSFLYPHLNDPNFNIKISQKKEFFDNQYDGEIHNGKMKDGKPYGIKEHAETLFNAEFSLQPHQAFVKNFLSFQTPYNSLLLYHGLGSGKTCSAIGVCEESRDYFKQLGINKRIIIVASPNVIDNFKLQLFDERKLTETNGLWNISSCVGNKLLNEINPTKLKGLTREKIISQIKNLINVSYLFLGYIAFSRYIGKIAQGDNPDIIRRKIQNEFNSRLIIIDEVHNIRISDDNEDNKAVAERLLQLVTNANDLRLLLLSATPMYNNCKEIVWLLNIMNINDRRAVINVNSIFKKNGDFKTGGRELLIRKSRGYVSYVRGENPYTFPYRVFPKSIFPNYMIDNYIQIKDQYPNVQMNGKPIDIEKMPKYLDLYVTPIGQYQQFGYYFILEHLKRQNNIVDTKMGERQMPSFSNLEAINYTLLQIPLQALNIIYPIDRLEEKGQEINPEEFYLDQTGIESEDNDDDKSVDEETFAEEDETETSSSSSISIEMNDATDKKLGRGVVDEDAPTSMNGGDPSSQSDSYLSYNILTGTEGLKRIMNYTEKDNSKFSYKSTAFKGMFHPEKIGLYSSKIKSICDCIAKKQAGGLFMVSNGIVLIYSQYIDGGLIPMALALEEMGFARYGDAGSLFESPPSPIVDVKTMLPKLQNDTKSYAAKYAMITGKTINNDLVVKALTNKDNYDGRKIKVILISKAGSEGIDLKFIRQIHIMEPWFNMNRIEQIIGRGVRNGSHRDLPFEHRNVEIYLHGTQLQNKQIEAADLYVYRNAESKAVQIGEVSRILKENSIDCLINHDQINFTQDNFSEPITQILSSGKEISDFQVGDINFSSACDYKLCYYECANPIQIDESNLELNTYNEKFIGMNLSSIINIIKMCMKDRHFYKKDTLIREINRVKNYQISQIYMALTKMIDEKEIIQDKFMHDGYLVNIGDYYLFQPLELTNTQLSIIERSRPLDVKPKMIHVDVNDELNLNPELANPIIGKRNLLELKEQEQIKEPQINITKGKKILYTMNANYLMTFKYAKEIEKVERSDLSWYKFCGIAVRELVIKKMIDPVILGNMIVEHLVDELLFHEKIDLLNYFYSTEINENDKLLEYQIFKYLTSPIIQFQMYTFIVLFDKHKKKIVLYDKNTKQWEELSEIDEYTYQLLDPAIKQRYNQDKIKYAPLVGFMDYEPKSNELVFKIKDTTKKRMLGARCDESGKANAIKRINELIKDTGIVYTKENTKTKVQQELCIYQEFILRKFNKENTSQCSFLTFEEANIYNFIHHPK